MNRAAEAGLMIVELKVGHAAPVEQGRVHVDRGCAEPEALDVVRDLPGPELTPEPSDDGILMLIPADPREPGPYAASMKGAGCSQNHCHAVWDGAAGKNGRIDDAI